MDPVATQSPSPVTARSKPPRRRRSPYRRAPGHPPEHGKGMLTRVLRGVRLDGVDKRSQVGVALRRIRGELLDHLGGDDGGVTAPERILVEEAAKARVIAA